MRTNQLAQPGIDFGPLLVRADGRELRGRHLDAQVQLADMADIDNAASVMWASLSETRIRVSERRDHAVDEA